MLSEYSHQFRLFLSTNKKFTSLDNESSQLTRLTLFHEYEFLTCVTFIIRQSSPM